MIIIKYLIKKNSLLIIFIICLLFLVTSCSKNSDETKDISDEFENTTWETGKHSMYLRFYPNAVDVNIKVTPDMEPSDIDLDNFDLDKYIMGLHENIFIEKHGKDIIKIYNDNDLNLEFKIISDNEMKDSDGNIFKKR